VGIKEAVVQTSPQHVPSTPQPKFNTFFVLTVRGVSVKMKNHPASKEIFCKGEFFRFLFFPNFCFKYLVVVFNVKMKTICQQ
jgi:hypothetical protein